MLFLAFGETTTAAELNLNPTRPDSLQCRPRTLPVKTAAHASLHEGRGWVDGVTLWRFWDNGQIFFYLGYGIPEKSQLIKLGSITLVHGMSWSL